MNTWTEVKFSDLLEEPIKNGLYKPKEYHGLGTKIINMGELFAYPRLVDVPMERISLTENEKAKFHIKNGDLIFARRSLTAEGAGKCSIILNIGEETVFESSIIRARPDNLKASSLFLFYFFSSRIGKYLLGSILRQVAVAGITGSDLAELTFKIPPLPEQRAIASVLSSLDDKIELLQRQNATLEAMAEALFKQWFVMEAKEEWEIVQLDVLCDCITDKFDPKLNNNTTRYIGLEHIDRKKIYISRYGNSNDIKSIKFKFNTNDILFGKLRPYFHKVSFTNFNGVCSTDILVLRPKNKNLFLYSLFAFYQKEVVDFATYSSSGTRMPRVDWNTLKSFELYMPDTETLENFNRSCLPFINKITSNQIHISTLEKLRDTLLPKLMSGEVRVRF